MSFGGYNIYHKAECYGENLKTFYIGNTNIMNEGEKRKFLRNTILMCFLLKW